MVFCKTRKRACYYQDHGLLCYAMMVEDDRVVQRRKGLAVDSLLHSVSAVVLRLECGPSGGAGRMTW